MEQAAAYIAETGASFSSYLAGYRKQRLKLLETQGPVIGNDEKEQQKRTVATAWAVNFADVEKASSASADLLRLSAFWRPMRFLWSCWKTVQKNCPNIWRQSWLKWLAIPWFWMSC